jgi:hypothetical protein
MTLSELKDILRTTALNHKEVKTFDYGEQFEAAVNGNYEYSAIFMELPVLINYDERGLQKTFQFAIDIYDQPKFDDKDQAYNQFSNAEVIGDAYFNKLKNDNRDTFRISDINAVTFRNQTDDDLAGVRYELIITTSREFCGTDYKNQFEEC